MWLEGLRCDITVAFTLEDLSCNLILIMRSESSDQMTLISYCIAYSLSLIRKSTLIGFCVETRDNTQAVMNRMQILSNMRSTQNPCVV